MWQQKEDRRSPYGILLTGGEEARVHNPRVYGLAWWMWRDEWEREGEVAARVWWG